MDKKIVGKLIDWLINMVDEDTVRRGADALFDVIEEKVRLSENKFDDYLVLPAIALIRRSLAVPEKE